MGPLGIPEMIFIFVAALLIFGPKKLPELGRSLGKGMAEFRRASAELKGTFQREMDSIDRDVRLEEARKAAEEARKAVQDTSYYNDGEDDYYDEYGYDGSGSSSKSASSGSSTAKSSDSSSSTGESTDSGSSNSPETPSSDSSSNDETAVAEASETSDTVSEKSTA